MVTIVFFRITDLISLCFKGYDNGDVKLFDLRTQSMRFETNVSNGVTNIEFDRKDIEMNKMVNSSRLIYLFTLFSFAFSDIINRE